MQSTITDILLRRHHHYHHHHFILLRVLPILLPILQKN
jgi:hypothetical protein